jgi:uncharacterized membrane protein
MRKELHKINFQLKELKIFMGKQKFEQKETGVTKEEKVEEKVTEKIKTPPTVKEEPKVTEQKPELIEEKVLESPDNLLINKQEEKITQKIPEQKIKEPVKQTVVKKKTDFEKFIGENLMNKIGILILVISVGLGIKYAIGQGWINPPARIAIGLLTGFILISIAHKLRKGYTAFSSVLVGGGIAIFYGSIAFGFQMYELFSQTSAFLIMVAITGFAIVLSLTYDKKELAVLAILGGFGSPIMVSTGAGNYKILFTYIMILNIGMLILAYYKKWRPVNTVSYISTIILFSLWMAKTYDDTGSLPYQGALLFATGFYLIFFLMNIINNIKENEKFKAADFIILISNSFFYYGAGIYLLGEFAIEYRGIFTVSIALLNFVFAFTLYKREQIDRNLVFLLIGMVLTFVSLAAPVQLNGNYITMFWAIESVLLLWLGQKSGIRIMKTGSFIVVLLMIVSLVMDWKNIYIDPDTNAAVLTIILNKGFITGIVAIIALVFNMNLLKTDNDIQFMKKMSADVFRTINTVFVLVSVYIVFSLEIIYQVDQYYDYTHLTTVALAFFSYLYILAILLWAKNKQYNKIYKGVSFIALFSLFVYAFDLDFDYGHIVERYLFDGLQNNFSLLHFATVLIVLSIALFSWLSVSNLYHKKILVNIILWMNVILSVFILSIELNHIVFLTNNTAIENYNNLGQSVQRIGWPILWGVFAFILMIIGMKKNMKMLRIIALSLFFFTILKLFAIDVWNMSPGGRFAAFGSLGILFIVVSFLYQKLRKLIFEEEEEEMIY